MFDLPILQSPPRRAPAPANGSPKPSPPSASSAPSWAACAPAPTPSPCAVGLYITAAYWFTASTSFANPAVTIARSLSDTFAGIPPADAPAFIVAQLVGGAAALLAAKFLEPASTA